MPFQWIGGSAPPHLIPKKVLVLGPAEMYDSDYPLVKKVLDEFTLRLEHFHVVVLGDGLRYNLVNRERHYYGYDRVVLKWCDHYKYTRVLLPEHRYASLDKRNKDLRETLGRGAYCLWFKDDEDRASRRVYYDVVREAVHSKRTQVVRV